MKFLFIIRDCSIEPLGILYLSSGLKRNGHIVGLYKYKDFKDIISYLDMFKPDIVGLSMTTGQHIKLLEIASIVKNYDKNIKTIVGGAHPTYFPQISDNCDIDYIVRGEADFSLVKLVNDLSKGIFVCNKVIADFILPVDLDSIDFPDREIIYKYPEYYKNKVRNVLTSRGCPFSCSYCYSSAYKELYKGQRIVRYRSPVNIIKECEQIVKNYPVEMFFFADDEFSMDITRLREIRNLYVNRINLPFHCQIRIDLLNEKRISILKNMGCYSLTFAIESGNGRIRRTILNRNISNQQIIEGCKLLKQYKIKFRAENMIGLPYETFKEMVETVELNVKVKPDYAWVSIYQPYPNTVLGEFCKRVGLFNGSLDGVQEKFSEGTVLNMPLKDKNRLVNLQRLFALVVKFKFLIVILDCLLNLPFEKFYTFLREEWKRYSYKKLFIGV